MRDNAVINFNEYSETLVSPEDGTITFKRGSLTIKLNIIPPSDASQGSAIPLIGDVIIESSKNIGLPAVSIERLSNTACKINIEPGSPS